MQHAGFLLHRLRGVGACWHGLMDRHDCLSSLSTVKIIGCLNCTHTHQLAHIVLPTQGGTLCQNPVNVPANGTRTFVKCTLHPKIYVRKMSLYLWFWRARHYNSVQLAKCWGCSVLRQDDFTKTKYTVLVLFYITVRLFQHRRFEIQMRTVVFFITHKMIMFHLVW